MSITAEGVREWPLLMRGDLVLKSIKDIKTQTRRVPVARWKNLQVGDRLWVRETWREYEWDGEGQPLRGGKEVNPFVKYIFRADYKLPDTALLGGWRPSIFMPRQACRLVLEVTAHHVERLTCITAEDVIAEGLPACGLAKFREHYGLGWKDFLVKEFRDGWNHLNAARGFGWDTNPDVKVIQYRRIK